MRSCAPSTPRQAAFKAGLEEMGDVGVEALEGALEQLPSSLVERLAEGPRPSRWVCGVCEAFGRDWYSTVEPDLDDPKWVVWAFHEVPKADMNHRDQLHYGELANEIYRRCLATYRAAGWDGEAPEPNA